MGAGSGLPVDLALGGTTTTLRRSRREDVAAIMALLVDDPLGATREGSLDQEQLTPYLAAFDDIDADPRQLLVVGTDEAAVVATMQVTFIPGLSRRGALRAQIEAVRVAASHRGRGLGAAMIRWAISDARERGCAMVQLTSDRSRLDAHRFYDRLGFVASHVGYKLTL